VTGERAAPNSNHIAGGTVIIFVAAVLIVRAYLRGR
jgi:hypothetical protein